MQFKIPLKILFLILLRIRRTHSKEKDFQKHFGSIKRWFLNCDYTSKFVENKIGRTKLSKNSKI